MRLNDLGLVLILAIPIGIALLTVLAGSLP